MKVPKILTTTSTTVHINILDSCDLSEEHLSEVYDECLARIKCIMAVVNQSGYSTMLQAYGRMEQTPLFRNGIKHGYKAAMKCYDNYISRLRHGNWRGERFFHAKQLTPEEIAQGKKQLTSDEIYEWWVDVGACAYKRSQKELEMLRWQIYHALTYKHVDRYREELSYACLASSILKYSADMFDILMRDLHNTYKLNFRNIFREFSLRPVYQIWRDTTVQLCELPDDNILPQTISDNLNTAFRAFEIAMMRDLNNGESANEAIQLNSDLLEPEEYEAYRKNYDEALEQLSKS